MSNRRRENDPEPKLNRPGRVTGPLVGFNLWVPGGWMMMMLVVRVVVLAEPACQRLWTDY